jgi:hypothetical protein
MALLRKIDSNNTGLAYAEEETITVLPTTPTWHMLEPNSYKDFGAEIKTVARNPINRSRQRKKGVVVDLDASGGFEMDLTASNLQDLMQGFCFASLRTKDELDVAIVDGSGNDYEPASGGDEYETGDLLFAKSFSIDANNGLKLVTGLPAAASVPVTDTGLLAETGASGIISRVGYQFGTGLAVANATVSAFPKLEVTNTAATGTYTLAANISDGDTVTIGGHVYTFETGAINVADEVLVGASASDTLDNLIAAINAAAGAGTLYGTGTVANAYVTAAAGAGDTMVVTAKVTGAVGNKIATTESGANSSWGSTFLTGGAGRDLRTLGLVPGEFVFVGGDDTGEKFATAANNGFARVREVLAGSIEFDKTSDTWVDDAGTGKTIRLFFGRVLKNESDPELIVRRTYQLERTLGAPDSSSTDQQAEYLVGSVPNQFTVDMKTANKVTVDLDFLSSDREVVEAGDALATGNRPDLVENECFNTTGDVARVALTIVSDTDSNPTPLFAFLTDVKLKIDNNVKQNKAIGTLGAFDSTAGTFTVDLDMTAYFQTVEATEAVRTNEDVSFDMTLVKDNTGVTFDLVLLSLGDGRPDVKQDEPIQLPLKGMGATGAKIDQTLDHTLFLVFWDYLPDAAA